MKYSEAQFKYQRIEIMRENLSTNASWALRGLIRIFELQTAEEQNSDITVEHNGVGFSGVDAEILSSLAKQYQRRGSLSSKQMDLLFKKMPKYAKQLDNIAQGVI